MHNIYIYTVYKTTEDALEERTSEGFKGGHYSTDGLLILGDRGRPNNPEITDIPTIPSYLDSNDYPNWPHMDHDGAHELTHTDATTQGGSDGWTYSLKS